MNKALLVGRITIKPELRKTSSGIPFTRFRVAINRPFSNNGERVAVFLTLQDLQGDLIKGRHKDIFKNKIDLLIVDETHFGARADSYGKVLENTKYVHDIKDKYESEIDRLDELDDNIKAFDVDTTLHLSGTPYRILMGSEFENEDIISFC